MPGKACFALANLSETNAIVLGNPCSARQEYFVRISEKKKSGGMKYEHSDTGIRGAPEAHLIESGLSAPLQVRPTRACLTTTRMCQVANPPAAVRGSSGNGLPSRRVFCHVGTKSLPKDSPSNHVGVWEWGSLKHLRTLPQNPHVTTPSLPQNTTQKPTIRNQPSETPLRTKSFVGPWSFSLLYVLFFF